MFVNVKILGGRECTLEVSASQQVTDVKEQVQKALGIPVNNQRLVYRGKTLTDSQKLSDYNIVPDSRLHLVVSNRCADTNVSVDARKDSLREELRKILHPHFTAADMNRIIDEFEKDLEFNISILSLDDIERLAYICLGSQAILPSSTPL